MPPRRTAPRCANIRRFTRGTAGTSGNSRGKNYLTVSAPDQNRRHKVVCEEGAHNCAVRRMARLFDAGSFRNTRGSHGLCGCAKRPRGSSKTPTCGADSGDGRAAAAAARRTPPMAEPRPARHRPRLRPDDDDARAAQGRHRLAAPHRAGHAARQAALHRRHRDQSAARHLALAPARRACPPHRSIRRRSSPSCSSPRRSSAAPTGARGCSEAIRRCSPAGRRSSPRSASCS